MRKRQTAAHLIGYLDYEGNGVTGIEAACDEFLSAHGREVEVSATLNALQQVIPGLEPEVRMSEDAGAGVVLTIDREIQQCVEEIGGEMLEKGAIVVLNPYSGQIKAAASFPAYSPLHLEEAVADAENSPMLNRAFLPYSVGSTFKVVTAAAALETLGSEYCLTREYECVGYIDVLDQRFHCHDRVGHGELDLFGAVKESCNPWLSGWGWRRAGRRCSGRPSSLGSGKKSDWPTGLPSRGAASGGIRPHQPGGGGQPRLRAGEPVGLAGADRPDDGGGGQRRSWWRRRWWWGRRWTGSRSTSSPGRSGKR